MKKTIAIVFAFIAAGASGAFAADLVAPKSVKAATPAKSQSWTSCYIGGNLGGAVSSTKVTDETSGEFIASLNSNAFAGGGQIGCDYQLSGNSPWVLGAHGMLDATALSDSTTPPNTPLTPLTLKGEIQRVATVTARAGYLITPDVMLYAKAGGAWASTKSNISGTIPLDPPVTIAQSASFSQSGWTAGVGAEWKLVNNFSVFAEYNYLGLSDKVVTFEPAPPSNIGKVHQDVQLLLVGANFRFGSL